MPTPPTPRERLRRHDAEATYIRAGELEVYRQLQRDAASLDRSLEDDRAIAVGPFSRLRADIVVDELGKTRGAINNLWGSQEGFRATIMHLFLDDQSLGLEDVRHPDPTSCPDLDVWIDRWAEVELERGPHHGMVPSDRYGMRWAAWLGLVPYGIWSDHIADASMHEYRAGVAHTVAEVLGPAFEHFGLALVEGTTMDDLAVAVATVIEGCWLTASLTSDDPIGRDGTIAASFATTLRMLVRGATTREPSKSVAEPGPDPARVW